MQEQVLGLLWNPSTDELSFNMQVSDEVQMLITENIRPTKRQVLRCVMSLFDPLGLLATFLIHGKILVQDLWRTGTGWDEEIADNQYEVWSRWIHMISFVASLRISRCYFPSASMETYDNAELHVFVDASQLAYSCALYLRTIGNDGTPRCILVAAKAKVAPLKPMTIPKLELQGCLLGTRMMQFVLSNHSITVKRKTLWTDSSVALSWIRADPRNYRPFVANRVGEILEVTKANEWRWVPSACNPADEATKWGSGPYFSSDSKWFHGPEFLRKQENEWPSRVDAIADTAEEMRTSLLFHATWEPVIPYERYSRWEKMQRVMAYILRLVHNAGKRGDRREGPFKQQELEAAENELLKQVQMEAFADEVTTLKYNLARPRNEWKPIDKSSTLHQFMPILDENGIIRQNSRISAAKHFKYNMRYPIVLPRRHKYTELLVERFHRLYRHANSETVVNEIRQVYAIPRLRSVVREVSRNCQFCKIRRSRPSVPPMAPLPLARLAAGEHPFSYVGLDYFGPLLVKQGRATVKRWVALFTCLTVRAVHLEMVYSLTTQSCILSIRRFICRRGAPVEIFSDNATNFHGAERVLRQQIDQDLASTFTSSKTRWTFIPPSAPHMGGAWERLVRSVKMAMGEAYSEGRLNDEELLTLISEAESIVNSRPLTYLPLKSAETEALTPNHFLLGSSSGFKQPCVGFDVNEGISWTSWERIQQRSNRFWQRWIREFLPVIRKQTKWFDECRRIQLGDVVLVVDEGKRNGWIKGHVVEVIEASDGQVRQAVVKTANGTLRRPVSKLAVLDVSSSCDM